MEIDVTVFIHIMNFILEQIKIIVPNNLLLEIIIEQSADLLVVANLQVEELHF